MFSSVSSFGLTGIACYPVTVEADVSRAFPCFEIVGLPDAARQGIQGPGALRHEKLRHGIPVQPGGGEPRPADTKKTGAIYDLPILVGILAPLGRCRPCRGTGPGGRTLAGRAPAAR